MNAHSNDSGFRAVAESFIEGLVLPSAASFVGTVLSAMVIAVLFAATVSPRHIGSITWRGNDDQYANLTTTALAYHAGDLSDMTSIGVISESSLRAAISDSKVVTDAASSAWNQDVRFANLCAGNLTLWEVVVVADTIADGYRGVIVISVSPNKFARDHGKLDKLTDHPRLGIRSALLEAHLKRNGIRMPPLTGVYCFDNFEFIAARRYEILDNFVRSGPRRANHLVQPDKDILDLPNMQDRALGLKRQLGRYFDQVDQNEELLRLAIRRLQMTGNITVVLVEAPFNPLAAQLVYDEVYEYILSDYDTRIRSVAREFGIDYWQLDREADLVDKDFADDFHMGDPRARDRYTLALARRVSELPRPVYRTGNEP